MTNYSIGDFLIRIKNAAMAGNKEIIVSSDKKLVAVSQALVKMGFLDSVKNEKGILSVALSFKDRRPRIMDIRLISKPGLRIYMGVDELESRKSPAILLVSTPKGVMSSLKAIKERIGGEVIAEIW